MLGIADFGAFCTTILLFLALPGPGTFALLTSTAKGGFRAGAAATLGVIVGDQVLLWLAVAGVAALLAANPQAVDAQRRQDPNLDHESPLHELFEDQLISADLVILNKADLASAAECAQVEALVRAELPPQVKILRAEHGQMDVGVLLGLGAASEEHIHTRIGHHDDEHGHDDHDHDHDEFDAFVLPLPELDKDALLATLAQLLQSQEIYRIKGFVALPGKAMRLVLHGVGKRLDSYFDRPWRADEARQSQLVFIGHDLDQAAISLALQNAAAKV